MNFVRQSIAIAAAPIPAPTYDPALAPVAAADLQSVLDRDLAEALKSGELAPGTGAGVSIAVVEHGVRRVFSYGAAKSVLMRQSPLQSIVNFEEIYSHGRGASEFV